MNPLKNRSRDCLFSHAPAPIGKPGIRLILFAIAYWVAVRIGLLLQTQPEHIASIWPASGFALAILLLAHKRDWPALLSVIFITNALGNWTGGNSLPVSLGFALANVLEPALGAWVLIYFSQTKITFRRIREVFALFGVAVISNGITALVGAAIPAVAFGAPFWDTWFLWWVSDGLGIIIVAPVIVMWRISPAAIQSVSPWRWIETAVFTAGLILFAWLLFSNFTLAEQPLLRNYMLFPLLIWIAFRYEPRDMASALILLATIAIWNTLQGVGIFAFQNQTITDRLEAVQILLIVMSFSGLLLSAIIAERKQMELELKARQIFLTETEKLGNVGGWEFDMDTKQQRWTEAVYRIHEVDPTDPGQASAGIEFYTPPSRLIIERAVQRAMEYGEAFDVELTICTAKGNLRWVHVIGKADLKHRRIFGFFQDITEREQAEEALRTSLAERETLLKEVHHRVKNNLASIASLIGLQESSLTDPAAIEQLQELGNRVRSMALIHELLYQTGALSRINLQAYLERLAKYLATSYGSQTWVRTIISAAGVEMDLDTAIPCGLLVNELITNAFKYAFPDGKPHDGESECKITVSAQFEENTYTLTVSDNGQGFPSDLDWTATKSLGMQLVIMLGRHQLHGAIDLDRTGGTTFQLRFPRTRPRKTPASA